MISFDFELIGTVVEKETTNGTDNTRPFDVVFLSIFCVSQEFVLESVAEWCHLSCDHFVSIRRVARVQFNRRYREGLQIEVADRDKEASVTDLKWRQEK